MVIMMDKVFIRLLVPTIGEKYDILIPSNKKLVNVMILLEQAINELTEGWYVMDNTNNLYNQYTGEMYDLNKTVKEANIANGSRLIII